MKKNAPIIEVVELTRVYGGKKKSAYTAVRGVSFEVAEGEVYGLLGTNGAGKTSTLEVIEGLAPATGGAVRVCGMHPVKDRSRVRPLIGTMLQSGGLPSQLTVAETIRMWAGTCSNPRPTGEVLELVELTHRTGVKVGSLSGGEQRRLDLACALVGSPRVIFLDEPTTGLDPESRRNVWTLLANLKEQGVSMILTTHYLEEAERLCDRIGIMHAGDIVTEGSLQEIVSSAQSVISFELPQGVSELPQGLGGQAVRSGSRVEISTDVLQEDALRVLEWARSRGLSLGSFAATPASLESVFLAIAGKSSL